MWVLEKKLPYRRDWQVNQGDLATDITSAGVIVGLAEPAVKALAPLALAALYANTSFAPSAAEALPLWLEIPLVLLLVEFGKYWAHRLHHHWAPLWWLHAMHHSSQRLYVLNGLRFHPLNYLLNFSIAVFPVMALGFSPAALLGYLAITQPIVLLQHANIQVQHGWLNWIFSTPEAHRWHHSTKPEEANRNFGNALLIWDHAFGTFKSPEGFKDAKAVGLFDSSKAQYPGAGSYVAQLLSMLRPPCCKST